ncbi:MAG: ferrous iron transport protein B [candidate division NC10 bacterium]|nr:ferrous iron transport protein B [candidate division NC10 bacterium]
MELGCHSGIKRWKERLPVTFALAGNPNVGKSSVFNWLTGMGVMTANYPGKTVEVNLATTHFRDQEIGVMDLPGTYALGSTSEDQWVARQALLDAQPDAILVIVDATNLERNLYLPLQLLDMGLPLVIALNLVDEALRNGLRIDHVRLAKFLGVPVVPTVAIRGQGLDRLVEMGLQAARVGLTRASTPRYGRDIEEALEELADLLVKEEVLLPWGLPPRAIAILLLEEDEEVLAWTRALPEGERILAKVREVASGIAERHGEPTPFRIARERHGLAGAIGAQVETRVSVPSKTQDRLWRLTTSPTTGFPLLALALAGLFAFLFYIGDFLSNVMSGLWGASLSPVIRFVIQLAFGQGIVSKTLLWGFDAGINAALSVGIPYVLTFYLILSVLEDTGYLNSVAFLTDPFMHKLGLHGRAAIPLVAGAGCNVPAIMGTRVLATMRERILASTLVCLMPCSARTAVIAGAVSKYVGWGPAVLIYVIVAGIGFLSGWGLNRILPGRSTGLVMEMFPFRVPSFPKMLRRTWYRFKDFLFVATPIVLIGSFILGLIYETGFLWVFTVPLQPVVEGWLGLPAVAGLTLIFAVLRKELALQLLVALAVAKYGSGVTDLLQFMDKGQIFTYALVNTLYIPCIATIAVLAKELGWRRALLISASTILLALLAGGIVHRLLIL